jgi:DNA-directed RNA polymerase specialized sigma24 family protein
MAIGQNDLELLLAWLDSDPGLAGEAYLRLHRKLTMFFSGRKCGAAAEQLADDTLDRVIKKLQTDPSLTDASRSAYVFGVARKILQEHQRQPIEVDLPKYLAQPKVEPPDAERIGFLSRCVTQLTEEDRKVIADYYDHEKRERIEGRRRTATDLQKSQGALRVQVFRIRRKLRRYMEEYLARARKDVTFPPDGIMDK